MSYINEAEWKFPAAPIAPCNSPPARKPIKNKTKF